MNYLEHNKELHGALYKPEEPVIFTKADSALLKDHKPFFIPDHLGRIDYETELVVRISRLGKTISELEDVAAKGAEAVDAVSGATLVDTAGYLSAIVDAAKNAQTTQAVEFNGSSEDLKLNVVYGAAHGTKCFTSGAVATAGDTIVLSYIDEFQFAGSDAGVVGVPNSDSDFGAGYAEGKVLMSKRVNADYYSKMMAEKAGSTVSLDANYDAIQNHVNGMSIADAEALSKDEKAVDAVSGATLVDTAGYVGVLVDAAK